MAKRVVSVILVMILCVSMIVPVFAASFDTLINLEDSSASKSNYASYAAVYDAATGTSGNFSYTVPDGGATVIVFYSAAHKETETSARLFKSISSASWAKNSKLNFVSVDIANQSQSSVNSFMSKYDTNGVFKKNYYNPSANYLISWYYNYVKNSGNMSTISGASFSYCFVLVMSSQSGKKYIRYAMQGVDSSAQISAALGKFMDTSVLVGGYDGYLDSGITSLGKLSKPAITSVLDGSPNYTPAADGGYFDTAPSVSGTYSTGKVSDYYLQAATNRLSALRRVAGLSGVTMDATLNSQAQYGAVLLAASDFSHYPAKPSDMSQDFFDKGTAATSSSNIAAGRHLTYTPDGFMKDEGDNNLPVMGHRRWQLNPTMAKVGFGFAVNTANPNYGSSYKYYAAEKCMDTSGDLEDYRFISWPASGNFPRQLFDYDTAWSVTLSPAYYQTPSISNVKVTVTRDSDSNKWTFSNSQIYTVSATGKYFTVETSNYAVPNCIIFRPDGISEYDGVYTVVISGLKDSFGNAVSLSYKVDFFDADAYREMDPGWYSDANTGKKYYFNQDRTMVKSKLMTIGGKKYYFGKDGAMYTKRLISVSGKKYYMGADGAAYTKKLISVNGKKYYMGADGVAYKSKLISVDGKKYYIGSDCVAYKSKLASIDGKKYYFGSDCVMYKSKLASISGKKYYFGKDGVAYKSKLISVSGKKYYIGKDCIAYKSKFASLSGKKYYFGSDCVMYKSKTFSVSGVKWKADSNGVCKKV